MVGDGQVRDSTITCHTQKVCWGADIYVCTYSLDINIHTHSYASQPCPPYSDLPRLDVLSASDPFVVLWAMKGGQWVEVGRTETVKCVYRC